MISTIVSRLVILVFGTLYPAYASYKAVRTKNVKEYVKWMMYWIVFALFTCAETFTDVFFSWFPFYYEIKIILVLWLLSPATKGSSILYRKFVHPTLSQREQEIDDYIAKAKEQGYHTVLNLGTKGVNYATNVIMQTALKGGGGLVNQLKKSYSLGDLTGDSDSREKTRDEVDQVTDPRLRRRRSPHRSSSGSSRVDMFFPEVDVRPGPSLSHVRSIEDVSSGYSSAEPLYVGQPPKLEAREGLVRTGSVGGATRPRTRTTRAGVAAKKVIPEDSEPSDESQSDSEIQTYIERKMPLESNKTPQLIIDESSDTSEDFADPEDFSEENNIFNNINIQNPTITQNIVNTESTTQSIELIFENIEDKSETKNSIIFTDEEDQKNLITDESENQFSEMIEENQKIETDIIKIEICHEIDKISDETMQDNKLNDSNEVVEINVNESNIKCNKEEEHDNIKDSEENKETTAVKSSIPEIKCFESEIQEVIEKDFKKIETIKVNNIPSVEGNKSLVEYNTKNNSKEETHNQDTNFELPYELSNSMLSLSQRGGRYNKHIAPIPPEILDKPDVSTQNTENVSHPIKATLVLKPGIIKSVPSVSEDSKPTQIFLLPSPKGKRKKTSRSKSMKESPISKLMMLPKKLTFWGNKETKSSENLNEKKINKEKRKSWHDDSHSFTSNSTGKSISDTEGSREQLTLDEDDVKSISTIGIDTINNEAYMSNKMILRNLSQSPKQYRKDRHLEAAMDDID